MKFKEAIETAEPKEDVKAHGLLARTDGPRGFIVLDRETGRFVRSPNMILESNVFGYCGDGAVTKALKHAKDLFNIAKNYGVRAMLGYEAALIRSDVRDLKSRLALMNSDEPVYS